MDDISKLAPLFNKVQLHNYQSSNPRNASNELVIYEDKPGRHINIIGFLRENRYFFLTQRYAAKFKYGNDLYDFTVFDLWSEKEIDFKMKREREYLVEFYLINDRLGCFVEYEYIGFNRLTLVSLVEFDFIDKVFRKLKKFELAYTFFGRIFVDEYNPSKFTLVWKDRAILHVQSFELYGMDVTLGDTIKRTTRIADPEHYFNGCLYSYSAKSIYYNTTVKIYDLTTNSSTQHELDWSSVRIYDTCSKNDYTWIEDKLFIPVLLERYPYKYGIIWANTQSTKVDLLQFFVGQSIQTIKHIGDGKLMICAHNGDKRVQVYKIEMRKPDLLTNLCWFSFKGMVRALKLSI